MPERPWIFAGPPAFLPVEPAPPGPHCAACGYGRHFHEGDDLRCPAATADKNGRRGSWRDAPPPGPASWDEVIRRDIAERLGRELAERAKAREGALPPPPPIIPARPPAGPGEIAGYGGKQALGMGRKAAADGWAVAARYWMTHDRSEGCALMLRRGNLYAVATWTRKPGKAGTKSGWSADVAYGVQAGALPIKITHTYLEGLFK
jgi:hypothetical protein